MIIEAPQGINHKRATENDLGEHIGGGIRLHRSNLFGSYEVDVFSEDYFLSNRDLLTKLVITFAQRALGWSEATARMMYSRALRVEDLEEESTVPSVMVFRKEGVIAGVSAQRLKYIRTYAEGVVPVEYHILRGFNPEYRGEGMGRDSIELSRLIHRKAKFYAARNGGPVPVWATMQANKERDIFVPGTSHPWERFYDKDNQVDRIYQETMVHLHMDIRTNGRWVNGSTGVSIGDYPEYNRSYMPRPDHAPTNELLRRMEGKKLREGELGMNIKRGDSVITVIKFK